MGLGSGSELGEGVGEGAFLRLRVVRVGERLARDTLLRVRVEVRVGVRVGVRVRVRVGGGVWVRV